MQSEPAVEIEHRLAGNVDAGPHRVVLRLGVRDNDVQPIGGAALKDHDQALRAATVFDGAKSGASQKTRNGRRADHGHSAVAKEYAASDGHKLAPRRDVACYVLLPAFPMMARETLQATSLRRDHLL